MAGKSNTTNVDNLNAGMKSIVSELETSCCKLKSMEGNEELYNQLHSIIKSLSTEVKSVDYATKMSSIEESLKNKQHFYKNKFGIDLNVLPENVLLESTANMLLDIGIVDDYQSNNLFIKYMSIIEKIKKQKEFIDDIDEYTNNLKIAIEQQNDLKCELSNITYTPVGYTAEPININYIESGQIIKNCDQVVKLVKKIDEIEKELADMSIKTSELKTEQKKMYHGLPPNINQAISAVKIAEQTMKSMSKQLAEKLAEN